MTNLFTEYTPCLFVLGLIAVICTFALVTVKSGPDNERKGFGWIRNRVSVRLFQTISTLYCIACFFGIIMISM